MNSWEPKLSRMVLAAVLAVTLVIGVVATAQPPSAKGAARPGAKANSDQPRGEGRCQHGPGGREGHRPPRFEDLDTDGDGQLSESEAADIPPVVEEGFDTLDTDGDGYLSREELPPPPDHGVRGEGGPREHRPPPFEDLDTDGDGKLSLSEAAVIPLVQEEGFSTFDANHDGYLSESELPAPPDHDGQGPPDREGPPNGQRPPSFEEADANGDGKLTPEEAAGIPPVDREGFDTLDENADGYLTRDEVPPPPHMGPQARNRGDGKPAVKVLTNIPRR